MTQLQWPGLVMWPYKTNRSQQTKQVMCPEGKKLKMFSEHQNDYISSNLKSYLHIIYILSLTQISNIASAQQVCVCMCVCMCVFVNFKHIHWNSVIHVWVIVFCYSHCLIFTRPHPWLLGSEFIESMCQCLIGI